MLSLSLDFLRVCAGAPVLSVRAIYHNLRAVTQGGLLTTERRWYSAACCTLCSRHLGSLGLGLGLGGGGICSRVRLLVMMAGGPAGVQGLNSKF